MAPQYLIIGAYGFIGTQRYAALGSAEAIPTYNRTRASARTLTGERIK